MPLHNELWFPSPIWSGKFFNVDNDELKKFAYAQKERDTGVSISNVGKVSYRKDFNSKTH